MVSKVLEPYPQYRVPREPGSRLIVPSLSELELELGTGDAGQAFEGPEFCGKPLAEARQDARRELVELAIEYTGRYAPHHVQPLLDNPDFSTQPIVLSGHQPELFHAGVWFKNFVLAKLSQSTGAIAVNFLVDNDLCRSTSIRVPGLDANGAISARQIAFDEVQDSLPWELRGLQSKMTWNGFPERVAEQLGSLTSGNAPESLLQELWPKASQALERSGRVGQALAQGRHEIELSEGIRNLEVPLSTLVSTRAFARFSIGLLAELPRFHNVYNAKRTDYREAHRIRNSAHPVPPLEEHGTWLEAPWWIYRPQAPQRQRLWVRLHDDQLILSDRVGWQAVIEGRLDCDNAASQWLDILSEGVCLRPRALVTTMYLRLFIADLFLHGIGGGKYDQLTNGILRDFFELEPPLMAVSTATLTLNMDRPAGLETSKLIETRIRDAKEKRWDLQYHAENNVDALPPEAQQLIETKQQLLRDIPPKGEKWEWHQQISRVNRELSTWTGQTVQGLRAEVERLNANLRQAQLLESREFSFCLFPKHQIVSQLKELAELE